MIWYRSVTWWIGIAVIVLTVVVMVESAPWSLGGKLFPWLIGSGVLIAAGLHTILGIFQIVETRAPDGTSDTANVEKLDLKRVVTVLSWVVAALIAVPLFGVQLAVPAFVLLFMATNGEKIILAAISAAIIWGFIFFVLEGVIHVVFPQALIFQWLGL